MKHHRPGAVHLWVLLQPKLCADAMQPKRRHLKSAPRALQRQPGRVRRRRGGVLRDIPAPEAPRDGLARASSGCPCKVYPKHPAHGNVTDPFETDAPYHFALGSGGLSTSVCPIMASQTATAVIARGEAGTRTMRTGARWQLNPDVVIGLEATRQASDAGEADNEVRLRAAVRF